MTKEEAIKYLRQLYPNGGHCWLDEQRIEAIGMAINALQEEPVSIWHEARKKYPLTGKEIIVLRDDRIYYGKYIGGLHRYVRADIQLTDDTAQTYAIIDYLTKKDKWAYIKDLLNLSNVEIKKPVSEDLEKIVEEIAEPTILNAYGTKELARRLRNTICGTPVSEDLEEAASWYAKEEYNSKSPATLPDRCRGCYAPLMYAFKAGSKWQKAKDEFCSKDLGEYINELSKQFPEVSFAKLSRIAVRVAKWQKENLWKPADGDDLPVFDREVIVLIKYNAQRNIHDEEYPTYRVGFGHRPNPNGWDGKNIDTNEVTHYTPKLYDKGGWNAPDIAYWLDVKLPKEIEL